MSDVLKEIKKSIYSGAYLQARELLDGLRPAQRETDELRSLDAAVCSQLGETFAAEQLAAHFLKPHKIPNTHAVFTAFYLALGSIRISQYERGRFWLARALEWVRFLQKNSAGPAAADSSESPEARFFAFQGVAFYNFFCGNFIRSKRYAQKAHLAAREFGEPYGIVLSLEMLAQSDYRLGNCNLALDEFKNAREITGKAGFHKIESAIRISKLILSAQTGRLGGQAIAALNEAAKTFHVDDIYSKNELLLEVAQQMILCGRNSDARDILNSVSMSIYRVGHLRQAATLNLRLAYSMYLRGESESARALLLSHFPRLSPKTDKQLTQSYAGLLNMMELQPDSHHLDNFKDEVTARGLRIRLRQTAGAADFLKASRERGLTPPQRFEDPLGDLIDDTAHFNEDTFSRICNTGYYSLIPSILKLRTGANAIIIEKTTARGFLVAAGDVLPTQSAVKPQIFSLLQLLNQRNFVSRNQLTQFLWNSRYNPERHEKSLQSAITRLKEFLSPKSHWLEATKSGYRLAPGIELRIISFDVIHPQNSPRMENHMTQALPQVLNSRHLQFLKHPNRMFDEFFSSQEWADVFQVSLMTATRDLNFLCSQGRVMVTGKGRATRYRLSESTS